MKRRPGHDADLKELARILARLRDARHVYDMLYALLTPGERETLALRWRLVRMLEEGVSQRGIASALGISLCKITRGSRELKQGPAAFRQAVRQAAGQSGRARRRGAPRKVKG